MHGSNGGVGETCRKVTRPDPTHSLYHHGARPGGPAARVRRAWTASQGTVAIGDAVAPMSRGGCVDVRDGARRGERAGGHRDGHTPSADADRAQTDRP